MKVDLSICNHFCKKKKIRSILGQIRPDRQTLLFTATFKKKIQNLVMDLLTDPVTINIGEDNQANEDVTQEVVIVDNENQKYLWIVQNLPIFMTVGKVLIFVNQISQCQDLYDKIKLSIGYDSLVLHGDKLQQERTQIVNSFKMERDLMIATDVASRGLDIHNIKFVRMTIFILYLYVFYLFLFRSFRKVSPL